METKPVNADIKNKWASRKKGIFLKMLEYSFNDSVIQPLVHLHISKKKKKIKKPCPSRTPNLTASLRTPAAARALVSPLVTERINETPPPTRAPPPRPPALAALTPFSTPRPRRHGASAGAASHFGRGYGLAGERPRFHRHWRQGSLFQTGQPRRPDI